MCFSLTLISVSNEKRTDPGPHRITAARVTIYIMQCWIQLLGGSQTDSVTCVSEQ